jgi:hypothetical protein
MAEDWYVEIGRHRLAELNAGRAQAQADLELAKSTGDTDAASAALQNIADIDQAQANLGRLYDPYVRSQQAPPPPSDQERAAKPLHRMDYSDVYQMLKHSKYGVDDNAFREGIAEVGRRRARGE